MTVKFPGTVVCMASGPSLTAEDIEAIRKTGYPVIAVNSTWEVARFCDVIFAGDLRWWNNNIGKIDIPAKKVAYSINAAHIHGMDAHKTKTNGGYNSGQLAIEYAIQHGADRVLLLGYDCSVKHGTHHHGDHVGSRNPTTKTCRQWVGHFEELLHIYPESTIINCSRYTELGCFPVDTLNNAIQVLSYAN